MAYEYIYIYIYKYPHTLTFTLHIPVHIHVISHTHIHTHGSMLHIQRPYFLLKPMSAFWLLHEYAFRRLKIIGNEASPSLRPLAGRLSIRTSFQNQRPASCSLVRRLYTVPKSWSNRASPSLGPLAARLSVRAFFRIQ